MLTSSLEPVYMGHTNEHTWATWTAYPEHLTPWGGMTKTCRTWTLYKTWLYFNPMQPSDEKQFCLPHCRCQVCQQFTIPSHSLLGNCMYNHQTYVTTNSVSIQTITDMFITTVCTSMVYSPNCVGRRTFWTIETTLRICGKGQTYTPSRQGTCQGLNIMTCIPPHTKENANWNDQLCSTVAEHLSNKEWHINYTIATVNHHQASNQLRQNCKAQFGCYCKVFDNPKPSNTLMPWT